jgi:hypothetical protein
MGTDTIVSRLPQTEGVGGISLPGKMGQKGILPAPGTMPGPVHEEKWCRAGCGLWLVPDDIKGRW